MLLGNNLWSMKAANMADLAPLVFHFGALLFFLFYLGTTVPTLNTALYCVFISMSSLLPCPSSLSPLPLLFT